MCAPEGSSPWAQCNYVRGTWETVLWVLRSQTNEHFGIEHKLAQRTVDRRDTRAFCMLEPGDSSLFPRTPQVNLPSKTTD